MLPDRRIFYDALRVPPPDTFHLEIFADSTRKREARKKGKMENKRKKLVKGKVEIFKKKMEGGNVWKLAEDLETTEIWLASTK